MGVEGRGCEEEEEKRRGESEVEENQFSVGRAGTQRVTYARSILARVYVYLICFEKGTRGANGGKTE